MIAAISNHYLFSFKEPHNASCEHMIWNRLVPAPLQSGCFWTQIPIKLHSNDRTASKCDLVKISFFVRLVVYDGRS